MCDEVEEVGPRYSEYVNCLHKIWLGLDNFYAQAPQPYITKYNAFEIYIFDHHSYSKMSLFVTTIQSSL